MSDITLQLEKIERTFQQGNTALSVLRGCDLTLQKGERVALIGPSGSGKSTLLQIAGLLERPDSGRISLLGSLVSFMDDQHRTAMRRENIGFVYQYHHLLPEFSALENVVIPQLIRGQTRALANEKAKNLLANVGLSERLTHRPARLSGGEQQRVAIARALANSPKLLIADEPTGNLDPANSEHVFELLDHLVKEQGLSLFLATHNPLLAKRMDRVLELRDGLLCEVDLT